MYSIDHLTEIEGSKLLTKIFTSPHTDKNHESHPRLLTALYSLLTSRPIGLASQKLTPILDDSKHCIRSKYTSGPLLQTFLTQFQLGDWQWNSFFGQFCCPQFPLQP